MFSQTICYITHLSRHIRTTGKGEGGEEPWKYEKEDARPDHTETSGMLQGRANQNRTCQSCDQAYLLAIGK